MKPFLAGLARQLAAPVLGRLGVVTGAYLVAKGIPADLADQTLTAAAVFMGLVWDCAVILARGGR